MDRCARTTEKRRAMPFATALLALVFALSLCWPAQALAYFSKDPVSIYFGSTYLSLTTGSSGSVGLTIDPWSEQQLPGCGMSICPQACNGLETPEGVMGGCLNEAGWCTCAGTTYYTASTQVSVSSSNPYVARASVSGGSLSITAVSPGTATITVYASLSKHVDNAASMTVEVTDPAPTPTPTPTPDPDPTTPSDPGSGGGSGGSSSGGGSSSSGGSGKVSVSAAGTSATAAAAAAAAESEDDDEKKVVELEAEDGTKVIVVKATDAESAAEELAKIAGTEGTCTFWSGGTLDSPALSWTFKGTDLSEDDDLAFDPTVAVSKKGSGDVSKLLADVKNAIVMDFAHSGALPAEAEVYVRASGVYEDGTKLGLYSYNETDKKFELAEEDIEVSDGYAVYTIDHCSIWALSDENLAACEMPVAAAAAPEGQVSADEVDVKAQDGTPFVIGIAVVLAAAVLVAVVIVLRRRRANGAGAEASAASAETEQSDEQGETSETEGEDEKEEAGSDKPADVDQKPGETDVSGEAEESPEEADAHEEETDKRSLEGEAQEDDDASRE